MLNANLLAPSDAELLRPLPTGTVVRLPDGDYGVVQWSSYSEVHVVHPGRVTGAGPWYYARHQVEVVPGTVTVAALTRDHIDRLRYAASRENAGALLALCYRAAGWGIGGRACPIAARCIVQEINRRAIAADRAAHGAVRS